MSEQDAAVFKGGVIWKERGGTEMGKKEREMPWGCMTLF